MKAVQQYPLIVIFATLPGCSVNNGNADTDIGGSTTESGATGGATGNPATQGTASAPGTSGGSDSTTSGPNTSDDSGPTGTPTTGQSTDSDESTATTNESTATANESTATTNESTGGTSESTGDPVDACATLADLCEGGCEAFGPVANAEIADHCEAAVLAGNDIVCENAAEGLSELCADSECEALAILCAEECEGLYECTLDDFAGCGESLVDVTEQCGPATCEPACTETQVCMGLVCQPDADGDGVQDSTDNCPNEPNPDQTDTDDNDIGDACQVAEEYFDPGTGLTWMNIGVAWLSYQDAVTFCQDSTHAGATNWRLPNIDELRSLVTGCEPLEPGGACEVTTSCNTEQCYNELSDFMWCENPGCNDTPGECHWPDGMLGQFDMDACQAYPYWSSTPAILTPGAPEARWVLRFTGQMHWTTMCPTCMNNRAVRCVR